MNLARLLSAALLLAASQSAHAQLSRSADAPAPLTSATLSTNYRLTLAAKSGDKALGEISVLTCAQKIDASGLLDKPADGALPAAMLSLRGTLTELEGGALMLAYSFGVSTPVVTRTMTSSPGASSRREDSEAKPGDAKAAAEAKTEPRGTVSSMISFQDHISSGSVRVKAGSTYDLVTMAGVVYSLKLSPEPLK